MTGPPRESEGQTHNRAGKDKEMCFKHSITEPSPPDEMICSGWGVVTMKKWCGKVAEEIPWGVVVEEDGMVAVVRKVT